MGQGLYVIVSIRFTLRQKRTVTGKNIVGDQKLKMVQLRTSRATHFDASKCSYIDFFECFKVGLRECMSALVSWVVDFVQLHINL